MEPIEKKNVTIVGLGLIGGSIARAIRKSGYAARITGVEQNPGHASLALELGLADRILPLEEALEGADLAIVAIPVDKTAQVIARVLDLTGERTTVMDVGSTKGKICREIASHPHKSRFVPTHPMAGTEYSGPAAAVEGLFENRTVIVIPLEGTDPRRVEEVERMYRGFGSKIVEMDPDKHDMSVAYVSHISHISSFALALTVLNKERDENITNLAAGGFDSTARLAKSGADMWEPIFVQNKDHILDVIDEYIENMILFKHAIKSENREVIRTLIRQANKVREILDKKDARDVAHG